MKLTSCSTCSRGADAQRGFSLLEVLVSIVVLSFGVLGIVGLQAASMQANSDARYQSAAVRLGLELSDMMRDNMTVAQTVSGTPAGNPYVVQNYTDPGTLSTPTSDCSSTQCSASALAQFQIYDWLQRVSNELPGARVQVCFDSTPYDANGLPRWYCPNSPAVTNPPSMIVIKIGWTRSSTNRAATGASSVLRPTTSDDSVPPAVVLPLNPGVDPTTVR
ncbi:MAG: type IV pilus modification protein PilV [Proteobacteria bacterium]|nr:type IV pilus modification protein PilV [Pseudomonadota bacterium]